MDTQSMVVEIDAEISRLQRVKALLSDTSTDRQRKPWHTGSSSLPGTGYPFDSGSPNL